MFGKSSRNDPLNDGGANWWISSKSDRRFNDSGPCPRGIFSIDEACRAAAERKSRELGIEVPADLEFGGVND